MNAENVIPIYDTVAADYARTRDKTLFERRWLDRALAHAPGRRVLDLGCGAGRPIAAYLADRRCQVTGIDGSREMLRLFQQNVPSADAIHVDMRGLTLNQSFDLVIAWDSLFHLTPADQREMFATIAAHTAPRGVVLFTTGPAATEETGRVGGVPIYLASLAPGEYRTMLAVNGFEEIAHVTEDPECHHHTIWMARRRDFA